MPARNAAATVDVALRSTLRALPADAEIVVLDDASTDATVDVICRIGDPRIRVIAGEVNVGVATALNRLLAETQSEVVARMDADDVTLPGRFRRQAAALDRGAELVFASFQRFGAGVGLARPPAPVTYGPEAARHALLLYCFAHSTLYARRASLEDVGGYRAHVATEDYDLWLRAAAAGARIVRLGVPAILLRASAGQLTAQAGWTERIADDPDIADAYASLVERMWGDRDAPWLRELASMRSQPLTQHGRAVLEPFVHRFTASLRGSAEGSAQGSAQASAHATRPLERWSLTRRARQELGRRAR